MSRNRDGAGPLEAAAGAAGTAAIEAFDLLSNETRLAILLALWECYDPEADDEAVRFSTLYDRVGVRDSGNFSYHLDKLVGHYVRETERGYRLRNAGHKIVQAIIAGAGLQEPSLEPTRIARDCHRCGAPVEMTYADERLYQRCTECSGSIGPASSEPAPVGTLMVWDFPPAGLTERSAGELYVAGTIEFFRDVGLMIRGVCPECSGPIEESVVICAEHDREEGRLCTDCGTADEVRVSYACSVCKHGASFPVQGAVHDHPALVSFFHEHDLERTYDLEDPESCGRLWDALGRLEHDLVSEDPVRIEVAMTADGDAIRFTLDGDIEVIDIEERLAEPA